MNELINAGVRRVPSRRVALFLATACLLAAPGCGGGKTPVSEEKAAVEAIVRASGDAEDARDAEKFLALWTDKGLREFGSGTREEIRSGRSEDFGSERLVLVRFTGTTVKGPKASTIVSVRPEKYGSVKPILSARFTLVRRSGKWLIDGFDTDVVLPAAAGADVVEVKAQEYSFTLSKAKTSPSLFIRFVNAGKEAHEITIFKTPAGVDVATARKAVGNVDGRELTGVPAGYTADHITFADPGKTSSVSFAEDVPAGRYALACFIPQGGFGPEGPVDPNGKPHVQLGMIALLDVA